MKSKNAIFILLSALLTAGPLTSCGNTETAETQSETAPVRPETETETEEEDPFASLDFGGEEIHMLVSGYEKGGLQSSLFTVFAEEGMTGEVVSDAVYERNILVEDLLNVRLQFTDNGQGYQQISATVKQIVSSGDSTYDLIQNDLFPLASLSVSNHFTNIMDIPYLDFAKEYWYEDYMRDVSFASPEKRYILAGDYFMDILRSAHALYFNRDRFQVLYGDPDTLYALVLDGKWTQERFMEYSNGAYQDVNGDGTRDAGDLYGYSTNGYWAPMVPWVIGSDLTFLEYREDGSPYFALNNERSVQLMENLVAIFHGEGTYDYVGEWNNAFLNGSSLFGGYLRVASMENFRDMDMSFGILPFPKMDEAQEKYITSTHDITTVGVIPVTCVHEEPLGAVLEVLSRETAENVIPAYYETALKTKYIRDDQSAQMLDILRQNISCVFPVAFGGYCNNFPLNSVFYTLLKSKNTDFVSTYVSQEKAAHAKLDELWNAFSAEEETK